MRVKIDEKLYDICDESCPNKRLYSEIRSDWDNSDPFGETKEGDNFVEVHCRYYLICLHMYNRFKNDKS